MSLMLMACRGPGSDFSTTPYQTKHLQQQRHVAYRLDVKRGDARHQPVFRQPHDADDESEDCGEENAEARNQQGIQETRDQGPAVARTRLNNG